MKDSLYKPGLTIRVKDRMQSGYSYTLEAPPGKKFASNFTPFLTPKKMLELGIFEGKYCNDCQKELPESWFAKAKIADEPDVSLNYFGIKSRQPLSVWREKGWILGPDPRGWFQWYCRYWLGRRLSGIDEAQIGRWRNFTRHAAQIRNNCPPGALTCRPRQRQALLQWSWDPFI